MPRGQTPKPSAATGGGQNPREQFTAGASQGGASSIPDSSIPGRLFPSAMPNEPSFDRPGPRPNQTPSVKGIPTHRPGASLVPQGMIPQDPTANIHTDQSLNIAPQVSNVASHITGNAYQGYGETTRSVPSDPPQLHEGSRGREYDGHSGGASYGSGTYWAYNLNQHYGMPMHVTSPSTGTGIPSHNQHHRLPAQVPDHSIGSGPPYTAFPIQRNTPPPAYGSRSLGNLGTNEQLHGGMVDFDADFLDVIAAAYPQYPLLNFADHLKDEVDDSPVLAAGAPTIPNTDAQGHGRAGLLFPNSFAAEAAIQAPFWACSPTDQTIPLKNADKMDVVRQIKSAFANMDHVKDKRVNNFWHNDKWKSDEIDEVRKKLRTTPRMGSKEGPEKLREALLEIVAWRVVEKMVLLHTQGIGALDILSPATLVEARQSMSMSFHDRLEAFVDMTMSYKAPIEAFLRGGIDRAIACVKTKRTSNDTNRRNNDAKSALIKKAKDQEKTETGNTAGELGEEYGGSAPQNSNGLVDGGPPVLPSTAMNNSNVGPTHRHADSACVVQDLLQEVGHLKDPTQAQPDSSDLPEQLEQILTQMPASHAHSHANSPAVSKHPQQDLGTPCTQNTKRSAEQLGVGEDDDSIVDTDALTQVRPLKRARVAKSGSGSSLGSTQKVSGSSSGTTETFQN